MTPEQRKLYQRRYQQSEQGRIKHLERQKKYLLTPKGIAATKRRNKNYATHTQE